MSELDHASEQAAPHFPIITSQTARTEQKPHAASDQSVHRDLHQIIARAREEIHHLREQRAKMEADAAALIQERDDLAQRYADLEQHFLETVHVAAEEKIRRIADELDPMPRQVPPLLEPVADALSRWVEQQQREREAQLLLLLERAEQHLEGVHQQSEQERAALEADKARLAQQRKDFETQMELRRAALKHRWLARTWLTGSVMFLLFPALEIYLLTHGAQVASAIIISTAICLVLIALVGLVRSRRTPKTATPAPTKRPGE